MSNQETPEIPQTLSKLFSEIKSKKDRGRPHFLSRFEDPEKEVLKIVYRTWVKGEEIAKVAREYGVSYYALYRLLKQLEPQRDQVVDYVTFVLEKKVPFREHELIRKWRDRIIISGKRSALAHIPKLEKILTGKIVPTFRCKPEEFDLEKAQQFVKEYLAYYNTTKVPRKLRMAIRHFLMVARGISIPRGLGHMYGLSGEKDSYGKYAHVRLEEEQISAIKQMLDNDPESVEKGYNIAFRIGIETCSRAFAIASIPISRMEEIRFDGKVVYKVEVFEPKIKENAEWLGYQGKWWRKYISRETWNLCREFIAKHPGRELLFVDNKSEINQWMKGFRDKLRECYKAVGVREQYFFDHPVHALRHAGAHRLLRLTGWNYELVARLGGWKTPTILRDCYGAMPEEVVLQVASQL